MSQKNTRLPQRVNACKLSPALPSPRTHTRTQHTPHAGAPHTNGSRNCSGSRPRSHGRSREAVPPRPWIACVPTPLPAPCCKCTRVASDRRARLSGSWPRATLCSDHGLARCHGMTQPPWEAPFSRPALRPAPPAAPWTPPRPAPPPTLWASPRPSSSSRWGAPQRARRGPGSSRSCRCP